MASASLLTTFTFHQNTYWGNMILKNNVYPTIVQRYIEIIELMDTQIAFGIINI